MKKDLFIISLLLLSTYLFISCGGDDDVNDDSPDKSVVINDNGSTSNGSHFNPIDDKNFYLDYVKYTIEDAHLVVSGYDKTAFSGVAKIVSAIKWKGIRYEVLSIGKDAFHGCTVLTSITIPNCVTSIAEFAFYKCSGLTSVTIPNSVTSIGMYAFGWCSSLNSITIPNSVTSIGSAAFYNCTDLTSVAIESGVTSTGNYTFQNCANLTSVTIPNSVTSIGEAAFDRSGLTSVIIGSGVKEIGAHAFRVENIHTVVSLIENPFAIYGNTSDDRVFGWNAFNYATLYVPSGTIYEYRKTSGWKDFAHIEEGIPADVLAPTRR